MAGGCGGWRTADTMFILTQLNKARHRNASVSTGIGSHLIECAATSRITHLPFIGGYEEILKD